MADLLDAVIVVRTGMMLCYSTVGCALSRPESLLHHETPSEILRRYLRWRYLGVLHVYA